MEKHLKPHYILILIATLKAFGVILLFLLIASMLSPYGLSPNILRTLIPMTILIYLYVMFFWHGVTIVLTDKVINFKMKAGRQNHILLNFEDIESIKTKQGILEKLFGVERIYITIKGIEKTYADQTMVLSQYMVFKKEEAKEIVNHITKNITQ